MKIKNIIYTLITVSMVLLAVSCSDVVDYNDGYDDQSGSSGPPTVKMITTTTDINTAIDKAYVAEMISVHGDNLTDIKSIFVNDLEVNLETVYAVRSKVTFPIPRKLPMDIDNKVKITTELGSVTVPLEVTVPDLIVDGLYNEFALDDDTTKITGDFFDIYDITPELATIKLNGTEIPMIEAGETYISFHIPVGAPDNSVLTISSPRLVDPIEIKFRHMGYKLLDINPADPGGAPNWSWIPIEGSFTDGSAAGDPESLGGSFFRFHGRYNQYDWLNVLYTRFDMTDEDIINNPQNYQFKFEINNNSKTPLKPLIRIGRNNDAGRNLEWDPKIFNNGLTLNTNGQWKTLTFELLDIFRPDNPAEDGVKTNLQLPENAADRNHFIIVYNPLEAGDTDISLTNFRIVKKY